MCVYLSKFQQLGLKYIHPDLLVNAPDDFRSADAKWGQKFKEMKFTVQVAPEDCTGCGQCVQVCPAKSKHEVGRKAINMEVQLPIREREKKNWDFFLSLPDMDRKQLELTRIKDLQLALPLFEFSGCCAGCGETPYVKLFEPIVW